MTTWLLNTTTSPVTTYLFIVQVRLEPVPHHGGGQREAEVHEAQAPDVGRVAVVEETQDLLLGELEGVQLVQEAEGGGGDSPCRDSPHSPTHSCGAPARSLTGARSPGLQVVNFVIDLVNNLVKRPHLKQLVLRGQLCDFW